MNKKEKKRGKKFIMVLGIILGVVVCVHLFGFMVNKVAFKDELKTIQPYGKLVEVNGKKMHVYSTGSGEKKIVLLPGLGVSLPSAEFGPLMRELSKDYTVICIEYFGVGFSDEISTPRTNENYTEELRLALSAAGFEAPYILMPHSASGIYSEYYASKYPKEVSSIIMLDTTSTARIEYGNAPSFVYKIAKIQQACAFTRINASLVPETKLVKNGYTEKEISDYKKFTYHVINDTFINQSSVLMDNVKEVNKIDFPKDIPVMKIISKQTLNLMAKKDKDDGMGYQNEHLKRLGNSAEYRVLEGSHFIYQIKIDEIAQITKTFLYK